MTQQEMFGRAVWLGAKECKNTDIFVFIGKSSIKALGRNISNATIGASKAIYRLGLILAVPSSTILSIWP